MPDQGKVSDDSATTLIVNRLKATVAKLYGMNEVADNTVVGFHGVSEPASIAMPEKMTSPNGFIKQSNELLNELDTQVEELNRKLQVLHKLVN